MGSVWRQNNLIPWVCDDAEQDFFAAIGDYRLRVEHMGLNHWWWNVSCNGEDIMTDLNNFATSRTNAILLAEGVYWGHKAACMEYQSCFLTVFSKKKIAASNHKWEINNLKNNQDNEYKTQ